MRLVASKVGVPLTTGWMGPQLALSTARTTIRSFPET